MLLSESSLFGDGLRALLDSVGGFRLVGVVAEPGQALSAVRAQLVDIVLLDMYPGGPDTSVVTHELIHRRGVSPEPGVIILADTVHTVELTRAISAGAAGYVLKDEHSWSLIAAIRAVAAGKAWLSPAATRCLLDLCRSDLAAPRHAHSPEVERLSAREVGVLRLLALGNSNAEIAHDLMLAESTVKTHISRILAKLELRDRVQLAAFAYQHDIV